ncbi:MAG: BF3164 family lipoprotein [Phocaeicola sp.]|uniref:BF3164 family lipoprotein n=1 Tax=Phocaeicola sp. TaxID=2773926 RepID=UPI003F9F5E3C
MKNFIHFCLLLICLALVCCTPSIEKRNVINIGQEVITSAKVLKEEPLAFIDSLKDAKLCYVYKDSILIVLNKGLDSEHLVDFYNLNSGQSIAKLYHLGNGADGLLSTEAIVNRNLLILNDSIMSQVAALNIDSILNNSKYIVHPIQYSKIGVRKAAPFYDNMLVENPDYFHNKDMRINQGESRFLIMKPGDNYTMDRSYKYYVKNLSINGQILVNEDKARVIYGQLYDSQLEIYNSELQLIRSVVGPVNIAPKYNFKGDEGFYRIIFKFPIPYAYLNCTADNEYIYMVYTGAKVKEGMTVNDLPNWILKFDWDGNYISSYKINRSIQSLTKSVQDESAFYATILTNGRPELVKLSLK